MKYSISKGEQGEDVLMIDDKRSICPYASPLVIPTNLGRISIARVPCSTLCPHAYISEMKYRLNCGSEPLSLTLTEAESNNDDDIKIISLHN